MLWRLLISPYLVTATARIFAFPVAMSIVFWN